MGSGPPAPSVGGPPVGAVAGWLQPVVAVTTTLGVPTVFAGVLLWFVVAEVGGTLRAIERADEDRVRIIAAIEDTLIATLDRQTAAFVAALDENIEINEQIAAELERGRRGGAGAR